MRGHNHRKPSSARPAPTLANAARADIQVRVASYIRAWREGLLGDNPDWSSLLGIHLRLTELEHLEAALPEKP
jgi:hypothetical protein